MESKSKFYYLIIAVLAIVIIVFASLNLISPNPTQVQNLEECSVIQYNGENKINIVFFGTEEQSNHYTNFLLDSEPFNDYKESFNFYYISDYKPECELYKGIAILCHSYELIRKAASCPNDYIIVLKEDSSRIRSSSYKNVMSINTAHPDTVLLHEFGHSFANLAEEYTPANIPSGSKNCVSECTQFPQETSKIDGCFQECSKSNYYRSISNGVMRTLSTSNFGIFNENLIRALIEKAVSRNANGISITGNQVLDVYEQCKDRTYTIFNTDEEPIEEHIGCVSLGDKGAGQYYTEVDGLKGQSFSNIIFAEGPDESGNLQGTQEESATLLLTADTTTPKEKLTLYKDDEILKEYNLNKVGTYPCKT